MNFNELNYLGTRYKVGAILISNNLKESEIFGIQNNFSIFSFIHIKHLGKTFTIGLNSLRLYYKIKD